MRSESNGSYGILCSKRRILQIMTSFQTLNRLFFDKGKATYLDARGTVVQRSHRAFFGCT